MTRRTRDVEGGDDLSLLTSGKNITMLWAYIKNMDAKPEETKIK